MPHSTKAHQCQICLKLTNKLWSNTVMLSGPSEPGLAQSGETLSD